MEISDDKKRRLFDVILPGKMSELKQEMKDFKEEMHRKLDNGITSKLDKIVEKVMGLQCNVHIEKINNLQSTIDKDIINCNRKINGLYWAFIIVIVVGIVLGVWMKTLNTKDLKEQVSIAKGMEGYRVTQMIYRDFYK